MDLGWIGYLWSVVNTVAAVVSAGALVWIARELRFRENVTVWRRTKDWQDESRAARVAARASEGDEVALAGERAELSAQDGLAREAEGDAHGDR